MIQAMECADALENGDPSERTIERYSNLFAGEAGLVTLEAITITDECRARDDQLSIMPRNVKALGKMIEGLKKINPDTLIVFQLTHSGELSNPDFSRRITVKPLYGYGGELVTEEEMDKIMDEFVLAAKITHDIGADGIDLKLCHGYLGSQVLRPYNDRKWKYGGSWENRSRWAFELYERINKEVNDPDFLIGSKISAWEGFPGGFGTEGPDSPIIDLTEPIALIKGLEERGAQYFVQSGGSPSITTSITQVFRDGRNNGTYAAAPEKNSLMFFGQKFINEGKVDMVALGRQSLADPFLPKKLREGKENEIHYCTLCDHCLELLIRQKPIGCCTFNKEYTKILQETRKEFGSLKEKRT